MVWWVWWFTLYWVGDSEAGVSEMYVSLRCRCLVILAFWVRETSHRAFSGTYGRRGGVLWGR